MWFIPSYLTSSGRDAAPIVYDDDTTVVLKDKNINSLHANLISELENISLWINSNKKKVNVLKTNCILFKNRSLNSFLPPVFINSELIHKIKFTKFLGIVIDEHLNYKHHIDQTCIKLSKKLQEYYIESGII